jgi:DnaJ-class molecular chaperone
MRAMDFKDYYSTLGVAKTATEKEIKQAFRKLARKFHPDVNPGDKTAESKFKEINEAYEVLGDQAKRRKYDELGANWRMYEQAGQAGGPGPGWNAPFGGPGGGGSGGGFRTMTPEEMRDLFGDADPFSDFFHTFFGGMGAEESSRRTRGGRARPPRQGRDVEHELELPLEDAYHGTTRRLSLRHEGQARTVDVRIPPGVGEAPVPGICICGSSWRRTRGSNERLGISTPGWSCRLRQRCLAVRLRWRRWAARRCA